MREQPTLLAPTLRVRLAGWNYSSSTLLLLVCLSVRLLASDRFSACAALFASLSLFLTLCFPACCAVGMQGPSR